MREACAAVAPESHAESLGDDALFSSDEAARLLRVSPRTLADWRMTGKGPQCVRHGRNYCFYRLADLRAFIRAGLPAEPASRVSRGRIHVAG